MFPLGILCAFIALFAWGVGDFLLQRTIRVIGSVRTLFFLGLFGTIGLLPFVIRNLSVLRPEDMLLPVAAGSAVVIAALFDFEALKRGKISVVTPVISLELPLVVIGAALFISEIPTAKEVVLMLVVFAGILLTVTTFRATGTRVRDFFERGALFALCAALGMAITNVFVGIAGRETTPLVAVWFTHLFALLGSAIILLFRGELIACMEDLRRHPWLLLIISAFDNAAWISYAVSMSLIPIAVATTISEAYIALNVLLGIFVGKERITRHQIIGIVIAIVGVLALSRVSG